MRGRCFFRIVISALLFLGWAACPQDILADDGQPNVLFIAIDDLNDYIGPLGNHPGIKTPVLDRLAKQSVTFTNAHCAAPACHPSRVAVMTGVHPVHSGIYRNAFGAHGPRWRRESPMLEKAIVLSQHFRNCGYRAVGGGKIFHTLQWTPGDSQNDPDAWDVYRGDPLDPISADWPRPVRVPDKKAGLGPGRPLGDRQLFGAAPIIREPEDSYGDHLVVDWAIEQLEAKTDQPLFLAVGLFRPHIPWEVPRKWFDLYPLEGIQLPITGANDLDDAHSHRRESWHKWVTQNDQWKKLMRGYLASISYVDHQVGRLLAALERSPLKENTIVVLWSDHGFHIGEKENWEKFALWDQTTRVPLFVHAPGVSQDGRRCSQPVSLVDLYPTLCDLAHLPIAEQCDGVSLVPQLKNPQKEKKELAVSSYQFAGERLPSHAVIGTRYRLIRYGNGFEELYDLETDPHELTNRIDDPSLKDVGDQLRSQIPKNVRTQVKRLQGAGNPNKKKNQISNSALQIRIKVEPKKGRADGVLVAHGGDQHGYSIYIKDGVLGFAVRRHQELVVVTASEKSPAVPFQVLGRLGKTGEMDLLVNGKTVATGKAGGWIDVEPVEGASLGSDPRTPVGQYASPFRYQGKVEILKNGDGN